MPAVGSAAGNHSVLGTQPKFQGPLYKTACRCKTQKKQDPPSLAWQVNVPCIKTVAIGSAAGNHSVLGTQPEFWCITVALQTNSNSRKRKNNSIEDLASKRSACQTANDVCQSSNFIDHKLNSDFALPSELPLDHQTSRSNNEKRTSLQNPDITLPKSNEQSRSRLLERITSPFKDHSRII
ncbi:hypothetical protein PSHT_10401 [Puccinia striiformis]|uniref:Uncharacterized protein n=1 Tax=Puccinia striiformis TaxID=27350 RepID=A0A2S4V9Y0_9BASI|nr:hypothetical protein PSHT_10401 [Puccinia striiformis]